MIRRYRVSSDIAVRPVPLEPVPWTKLVPPGWQGFCCHCRRRLTVEDWRQGQIAAAGDGNPWHCVCMSHIKAGVNEFRDALRALARAVSGQGGVK